MERGGIGRGGNILSGGAIFWGERRPRMVGRGNFHISYSKSALGESGRPRHIGEQSH